MTLKRQNHHLDTQKFKLKCLSLLHWKSPITWPKSNPILGELTSLKKSDNNLLQFDTENLSWLPLSPSLKVKAIKE